MKFIYERNYETLAALKAAIADEIKVNGFVVYKTNIYIFGTSELRKRQSNPKLECTRWYNRLKTKFPEKNAVDKEMPDAIKYTNPYFVINADCKNVKGTFVERDYFFNSLDELFDSLKEGRVYPPAFYLYLMTLYREPFNEEDLHVGSAAMEKAYTAYLEEIEKAKKAVASFNESDETTSNRFAKANAKAKLAFLLNGMKRD